MAYQRDGRSKAARAMKTTMLRCVAMLLPLLLGCSQKPEAEQLRVEVLYTTGGVGDRSYCDDVYAGLVRASLDTDFRLTTRAPGSRAEAETIFAAWTASPATGPELMFTMAGLPRGTTPCAFGGRHVVELDGNDGPCSGLKTVTYRSFAPSFLAGVAAVAVSPRKKASVIGGMDIAIVNEFVRGFVAGVTYAGGAVVDTKYLSTTQSGFADPAQAQTVAEAMYADADVVFPVAGGSGMGVFEAAKEAAGRYAFGMDVDQSWLGRGVIVGSVVRRLDLSVTQAIHDEAAGEFIDGAESLGLSEAATDLVVNDVFADRVAALVAAARGEALAGEARDLAEHP